MTKGSTLPPTCSICGVAHWLRDGHQFGGKKIAEPELMSPRPGSARERQMVDITPPPAKPAKAKKPAPAPIDVARAALVEAEKPKRRGRPKGDTDRKAYQRELMRKKRAAEKAKP